MNEQLKRPGGRSALVQSRVRAALEELVAEYGRDQVTVPAVAERAGVSASSIYRRWGDLSSLLTETAAHRLDPQRPLADTGNLREDMRAWARELAEHMSKPRMTSLLKAAAALGNDEETDCLRNRKSEAETLVRRARARGEPAPEASQVVDHVIAPIVMRLLFGAAPIGSALADRLVDEFFGLMQPAAATSARVPAPLLDEIRSLTEAGRMLHEANPAKVKAVAAVLGLAEARKAQLDRHRPPPPETDSPRQQTAVT